MRVERRLRIGAVMERKERDGGRDGVRIFERV